MHALAASAAFSEYAVIACSEMRYEYGYVILRTFCWCGQQLKAAMPAVTARNWVVCATICMKKTQKVDDDLSEN